MMISPVPCDQIEHPPPRDVGHGNWCRRTLQLLRPAPCGRGCCAGALCPAAAPLQRDGPIRGRRRFRSGRGSGAERPNTRGLVPKGPDDGGALDQPRRFLGKRTLLEERRPSIDVSTKRRGGLLRLIGTGRGVLSTRTGHLHFRSKI